MGGNCFLFLTLLQLHFCETVKNKTICFTPQKDTELSPDMTSSQGILNKNLRVLRSQVMKCRKVAFGAGKGLIERRIIFTDIESMAAFSHKRPRMPLFLRLTPFCRFSVFFGFRKN